MSAESRKVAGAILIILPTVMIGGVSVLSLLIGDLEYMKNPQASSSINAWQHRCLAA